MHSSAFWALKMVCGFCIPAGILIKQFHLEVCNYWEKECNAKLSSYWTTQTDMAWKTTILRMLYERCLIDSKVRIWLYGWLYVVIHTIFWGYVYISATEIQVGLYLIGWTFIKLQEAPVLTAAVWHIPDLTHCHRK